MEVFIFFALCSIVITAYIVYDYRKDMNALNLKFAAEANRINSLEAIYWRPKQHPNQQLCGWIAGAYLPKEKDIYLVDTGSFTIITYFDGKEWDMVSNENVFCWTFIPPHNIKLPF